MNADAIRRYLQPSPTLRWHPWAPLAAGFLLLAFAFWLGAKWGFAVQGRTIGLMTYSNAWTETLRINEEDNKPARAAYRQAATIDAAIHRWVVETSSPPSAWDGIRDRIEGVVFWSGRVFPRPQQESVRKLAEVRLAHLSGNAPRWQQTTSYCDAFRPPLSGENIAERFRSTAREYSLVLGRTIPVEQLAPLVPGLRCEWQGPTPH